MRVQASTAVESAETLFRTHPISDIRNTEKSTRVQIDHKMEELRQLVGNRYRDLIDSADSIVLMKSSCESISANVSAIRDKIRVSLSSDRVVEVVPRGVRVGIYGVGCRVKYLVDTPENIWGCLDEFMLLEAANRYIRAKQVHHSLIEKGNDKSILSKFPLLQHQWQIVESFKLQISQRSRERLLSLDHNHTLSLSITAYADALAAVAIVDELHPKQVLSLFLESRKSCISQILSNCSSTKATTSSDVINTFCEVLKIIQVTLGQIGELFLELNDKPLFYKVILESPPASQLFGSIPDPHEEIRLWKLFRDSLESVMVKLDRDFVTKTCSTWLKNCGKEVVNKINGRYLIDSISSGQELASAEKLIRETMDGKQVLEGSLDWLKSVFGSEVELPWNRIRELVLGDEADLWNEIFEDAFVQRMKAIIDNSYDSLSRVVSVRNLIDAIVEPPGKKANLDGGVWFMEHNKKGGPLTGYRALPEENDLGSCLNAYFGADVGGIRDAVDNCCQNVLEDLLNFLDSPRASYRLKDLASYLQNKCYQSISSVFTELKNELENLSVTLDTSSRGSDSVLSPATIVERSLFVGRIMFAFQKHSKHIPIILGSPNLWLSDSKNGVYGNTGSLLRHSSIGMDSPVSDSPRKNKPDMLKRQSSLATAAFVREGDISSPQLEELYNMTRDLSIKAHDLWISWVSDNLSVVLSLDLGQDDGLSTSSPLRGWEDTVVKQQQSDKKFQKNEQSDESQSEMKITLPSMPSLYITSFLFQACKEVHRVGGHVLDKRIPQKLALRLLEKVISIYSEFLSTAETRDSRISDKGVLQVLLDLRFAADVLSGGDSTTNEQISKKSKPKFLFRRNQDVDETKSVIREQVDDLLNRFSKTLDPIDWLTYEPYLWENERQSYLRHAVLFGFFVQLNRMYTDTVQKLPSNAESNIMRCSTVPRFKYLPISAPAMSSRGASKSSVSTPFDDVASRNSWKGLANDKLPQDMDIDDESSLMGAAPFLKSFMQVGSRFGESTLKLGSMLTDGQVGRFKDKSAASMFGDMLPSQAAGLLSSFTASRSD